ncbi:MAG: hypothetical protein JXQ73_16040 [Phycisphaerae bacterium]|nr:hypothetical protein [Phycisphaerae bacterium]
MRSLLAVDMGLRAGLALYGDDGRLRWYRSRNFGSAPRLRRAVVSMLDEIEDLAWIVVEGGGPLADIWQRQAKRRGIGFRQIGAEAWRNRLLRARQQRTGKQAKVSADALARSVIEWSAAPRPTSLRHDAAEAILIGLHAVVELGWLPRIPSGIARSGQMPRGRPPH